MDYFSIGYNACCLVLQSLLQTGFLGRLTGRALKIWHYAFYFSLLIGLFWLSERLAWPNVVAIGVQVLLLYAAVGRLALGIRPAAAATAAILAVYIAQLSFGLVNSAETLLFTRFLGQKLLYLLLVLATAAAFLICAGCYLAVRRFLFMSGEAQTPYVGLLLLPGLFCFCAELYILNTAYSNVTVAPEPLETSKHLALLLVQLMGLAAMFCTLYAYRRICAGFQAQAEMQALRQAAQAQKVYIREAQLRYAQTRAFRHDIKNHLAVLAGLLQNGRLAEGSAYLQKLNGAAAELSFVYQTANPVVDILLAEKLSLAAAQGIKADVELVLPNPCAVEDFDWCVIFANALDNAINACQLVEGERTVKISGERQGDFYLLQIVNTCVNTCADDAPLPPWGIGLTNIKTVAEKYHGAVLTEKTAETFSLHVLLNVAPVQQ